MNSTCWGVLAGWADTGPKAPILPLSVYNLSGQWLAEQRQQRREKFQQDGAPVTGCSGF